MKEYDHVFNPGLLGQATRPQDCFLGIAIPLSLEAAQREFAAPEEEHDFIRTIRYPKPPINEHWWKISGYGDRVKKIKEYIQELQELGLTVKEGFSLADISAIESRFKVVTVLAHCPKRIAVELADGIHLAKTFSEAIPVGYVGIFDLTICHSSELQNEIKMVRPQCITIANEEERDIAAAMLVYKYQIKRLTIKEINYVQAITELRLMFAKRQDAYWMRFFNKIKDLFK